MHWEKWKMNKSWETTEMFEWVSASTLAKRLGISTQMVYIRIKMGMYETQEFQRGSMRGYLIKTPKETKN